MKHYVLLIVALLCVGQASRAQIQVSPLVVDNNTQGLAGASSIIESKLQSVLSQNGILCNYGESRFVLTAKFDVIDKQTLNTVPVKIVSHLNVSLGIGDGIDGTCYGTTSFEATGVASTEEQAIINAVKRFNEKSPQISNLITRATNRIIEYYDRNSASIIAEARALIKSQKYNEAVYVLNTIPMACKGYSEAQGLMAQAYKSNINHNSAQVLAAAKAYWAANPTTEGANEVANMLSEIDTNSPAYAGAKQLMSQISARFKLREDRDYALKTKEMNQQYALNRAQIKAAENIAVAYAKSRPRVVYNTRIINRWWY
jgi:hypothetical protein